MHAPAVDVEAVRRRHQAQSAKRYDPLVVVALDVGPAFKRVADARLVAPGGLCELRAGDGSAARERAQQRPR